MRVAGIMSGTSLDGIDVAIVDIQRGRISTVAFHTTPYSKAVRDAILSVSNAGSISRLNFALGELYARALLETCRLSGVPLQSIQLIGSHGQTIYHQSGVSTLQIGEASVIAERTGIAVVNDFRTRDIAAGGQGAPLVPFVDYLLFRDRRRGRIALNIGGIANVTALPARAKPEDVIAFDTGPGNMVIDALMRENTHGRQQYDRNGRIASKGKVNSALLEDLMRDPYYKAKPPKSAGREQYGAEFLERLKAYGLPLADLIATATVLTAATIALGIQKFILPKMRIQELIVSGGGAHNRTMMAHISGFMPDLALAYSDDYGISTDAKEAIAFAMLAYETQHRRPSNLPSATGARHPVILGKMTYA